MRFSLDKEVRNYFIRYAKHQVWVQLLLPGLLWLISDISTRVPVLFWTLAAFHFLVITANSVLLNSFLRFENKQERLWDLLFYGLRTLTYLVCSAFAVLTFYLYEPFGPQAMLVVSFLSANTEFMITTFNPNVAFASFSLIIEGFLPVLTILALMICRGQNYWIMVAATVYLCTGFFKIIDLHRRFVETTITRLNNAQAARLVALGEMAGGIAHEIKNPLTAITNSVHILEREFKKSPIDPDALEKKLRIIRDTSLKISNIVTSMQNLARDSYAEKRSWNQLRASIEDAINISTEKLKLAGINLQIDPIPADLWFYSVPSQFGQVILNLLSNAYDALLDQQKKEIHLGILFDPDSGLTITIADSGPGVATPQKLFNPFFTTKEPGKGTGLGLSLSKKIVESHEGEISYKRLNGATQFILRFPSRLVERRPG
ncbi:MAG: ATP-binding protein [Oligoflexia bacterium]|nr:ATP-binding protein [Oligoflexia bacterium]